MRHDFTDYARWDQQQLIDRLCIVASELATGFDELAMVYEDEKRSKIQGYVESQETTHAGREREAQHRALDATIEVFRVRAQQDALAEERNLLRLLIER